MRNSTFDDKCCGLMVGCAVGDALGAPVEGLKPGHIKTLFKILDDYIEPHIYLKKGLKTYRAKGFYTDDTQQMLTVCDTILENNGLTPDKLSQKFIELSREDIPNGFGVFRGTGRFFRATMQELINGLPWDIATGNTAGCMAAVRQAPVVIHYFSSITQLMTKTIEASLVTHKDPIAICCALWMVYLLHELISDFSDEPPDITDLLKRSEQFCAKGEKILASNYKHIITTSHTEGIYSVSSFIKGFAEILQTDDNSLIDDHILDYANKYSSKPIKKLTVPFSLAIIPLAIKIFFQITRHSDASFEKTIVTAINLGGDTDTLGALVGALAGGYYGFDAIPQRWKTGLVNINQIKLRAEILSKNKKKKGYQNLFEMEKKLTQFEALQFEKYSSLLKKKPKKPSKKIDPTLSEKKSILPPKEKKVARRKFEKKKTQEKKYRRQNKTEF